MPSTLTVQHIVDETMIELGGSSISVELVTGDIKKAIKDAIRVYNHYRPRRIRARLQITPGVKQYPITHPGLHSVGKVQFVDAKVVSTAVDVFDPLSYRNTSVYATTPFAEREMSLSYLKIGRQIDSTEPESHGQWEDGIYYLYIDAGREGLLCGYEATWHMTPDDHAVTGIRHLDSADEDWILSYVLAKSKMILSRVRGKFGGITNSEGASDPTDAAELRDEGREDLKDLVEALKKRRRPLPPVVG